MGDIQNSDGIHISFTSSADSVSLGSSTIDDDLLLRQANLLNTQIESLYQASIAMGKVAAILNKLGLALWV
ncbi:MAG: hypothetical protein IJU76_08325 [Desulfovibrionaceae bacterium]|nr:hypothetical protein [Desulfovibrionaceae bacterium]